MHKSTSTKTSHCYRDDEYPALHAIRTVNDDGEQTIALRAPQLAINFDNEILDARELADYIQRVSAILSEIAIEILTEANNKPPPCPSCGVNGGHDIDCEVTA